MSLLSRSYRALRGGCWCFVPQFAQVAYRNHDSMYYRYYAQGLRLVRRFT